MECSRASGSSPKSSSTRRGCGKSSHATATASSVRRARCSLAYAPPSPVRTWTTSRPRLSALSSVEVERAPAHVDAALRALLLLESFYLASARGRHESFLNPLDQAISAGSAIADQRLHGGLRSRTTRRLHRWVSTFVGRCAPRWGRLMRSQGETDRADFMANRRSRRQRVPSQSMTCSVRAGRASGRSKRPPPTVCTSR